MKKYCIIRYGEIALKGKNRIIFEKKLQENLKRAMKLNKLDFVSVKRLNGRFLVEGDADYTLLANVFGVTSISFASEFTDLFEGVDFLLKNKKFKTFRISTRKVNALTKKSKRDFDCMLGDHVCKKYKAKVSLKEFDINVNLEIIGNQHLFFLDKIVGIGGLPYGIEGRMLAFIENDRDKLAALLMMKRGCAIVVIGDADFTSYGVKPRKVSFDGQDISTFLEKVAKEEKCDSVVLGQTLENYKKISTLIEFRPLIGLDDDEIEGLIKTLLS